MITIQSYLGVAFGQALLSNLFADAVLKLRRVKMQKGFTFRSLTHSQPEIYFVFSESFRILSKH